MTDLPRMSSSEEVAFKSCRRAWAFQYRLGYAPVYTNRNLSVGIGVHLGLEQHYLGASWEDIHATLSDWASERWAEVEAAGLASDANTRLDFIKDRDLVADMVERYREWLVESGVDDDFETVSVEEAIEMQVPDPDTGDPFVVMPCKLDLLQRSKVTGRLRVVDFKTRKYLTNDLTGYELSEQNGNYALAVMSKYGEVPASMAYRELKKVTPSGRSKPPYFQEVIVRLTPEELVERAHQYIATAKEALREDLAIYANPSGCCGSWKKEWATPCLAVSQGCGLEEALEQSQKHAPRDPYERYQEGEE